MSHVFQVILQFHKRSINTSGTEVAKHYQVQVIKAPGRGWGGPMLTTGLDANQIRSIRAMYRGFLARQQARGETAGEWTSYPLQQIGNELFEALPESVQLRLQQSQAFTSNHRGHLQITLTFEPAAEELLDLPWECLHDPHGRFFYGLRGGGIVRCLQLPTAPENKKQMLTESTLGLWAEPSGLETLVERHQYDPAPGKGDDITWLQGPDSVRQLQKALNTEEYDSLFLTAHGRAGSAWDFTIALENEQGGPHWVGPGQLALLLSQYPSLQFVYLDVCAAGDNASELLTEGEATHPFSTPGGAAGQLLGVGLTAVVVMQDRVSQAASGQMAERFYREIVQGSSFSTALTTARRTVQLHQGDVIHWSVPALYVQQPTPQATSPTADWLLDKVATPSVLGSLLTGLVLLVMIGKLAYELAQIQLGTLSDWHSVPALLAACAFVPILAAAVTITGQDQLEKKYSYHGRGWLPFLWHKYFSAFVWAMIGWFVLWLVWFGIYGTGLSPGITARQILWVVGLMGVALAAHVGARQAIRQDLLFRRIGFSLFRGGLMDIVVLLFLLLTAPFLPLLLAWGIWWLWLTSGGTQTGFGFLVVVLLALGGAFLRLGINR